MGLGKRERLLLGVPGQRLSCHSCAVHACTVHGILHVCIAASIGFIYRACPTCAIITVSRHVQNK